MKKQELKYFCEILSAILNCSTRDGQIYEVMEILDRFASNIGVWNKFDNNRWKLIRELKKNLIKLTNPS